jgi:prefoldin subunit 5
MSSDLDVDNLHLRANLSTILGSLTVLIGRSYAIISSYESVRRSTQENREAINTLDNKVDNNFDAPNNKMTCALEK